MPSVDQLIYFIKGEDFAQSTNSNSCLQSKFHKNQLYTYEIQIHSFIWHEKYTAC